MNKSDLIIKYFENTLTEEEQKTFNHFLSSNNQFRQEVEFQQQLQHSIYKSEQKQLKQFLQKVEQKNKKKSLFKIAFRAAASLLIIVFGLLWYFQPTPLEKIYKEHFTIFPNVLEPNVRNHEKNQDHTSLAFTLYDQNDFQSSEPLFLEAYSSDSNTAYLFYYTMSLLGQEKIEEAVPILESNDFEQWPALNEAAEWYLALAYLKSNQKEKATAQLQELIEIKHYKAKEAQIILSKLE